MVKDMVFEVGISQQSQDVPKVTRDKVFHGNAYNIYAMVVC